MFKNHWKFTLTTFAISFSLGFAKTVFSTQNPTYFLTPFDTLKQDIYFADFNNDKKADLVERELSTGNVSVYFNQINQFSDSPNISAPSIAVTDTENWELHFADMTGDGRADLINRSKGDGNVFIHRNESTHFSAVATQIISGISIAGPSWKTMIHDLNGDGFAEILNIDLNNGTVFIHNNSNGKVSSNASVVTPNLAVINSDWDLLIGKISQDGSENFVNLDLKRTKFHGHRYFGNDFSPQANEVFFGPQEIHEHQYFLEDLDADGIDDVIQHNLRRGDILGYKIKFNDNGTPDISWKAKLRDKTADYSRSSGNRNMAVEHNRSLDLVMWYDNEYSTVNNRPDGNGAWWNLYYSQEPPLDGVEPNLPASDTIYRSATPLLGLYESKNPNIIKQHAYWMKAMGVTAVVIDWTNMSSADYAIKDPNTIAYKDGIRQSTQKLLETYSSISEFVPPKVFIITRPQNNGNQIDVTETNARLNEIYSYYRNFKDIWYTYDDQSSSKNKPMLLLMPNFNELGWAGITPNYNDPRFNIRFTNGYFLNSPNLYTDGLTPDGKYYFKDNLPLWNFVENQEGSSAGEYTPLLKKSAQGVNEQSAVWVAVHKSGHNWDGQLNIINGKTTLERTAEKLLQSPPRITLLNRFNYPLAYDSQPQEGVSPTKSTMIEPSKYFGFDVYNDTMKLSIKLAKHHERKPGKPIIENVTIDNVQFSSSGYPIEYRIGSTPFNGEWKMINITKPQVPIPTGVNPNSFYVTTRNVFGQSTITHHH